MALKARDFAHSGRLYGQLVKGVLVPEIVKYRKLEVAALRLAEGPVCRLDKSYVIEPGDREFPPQQGYVRKGSGLLQMAEEFWRVGFAAERFGGSRTL